jgi:hypothetical protein
MSKRLVLGSVVGIAVMLLAAVFFLLAGAKPTEEDVRAAVLEKLPADAVIDDIKFEVFADDRSSGRASVKGTYSFDKDIYSRPEAPQKLLDVLAKEQIFDRDVAEWWSANASFYPQFGGRLAEYELVYKKGERLEFSGELPYIAIVDGFKLDTSGLEFKSIDGTAAPEFGYLVDDKTVSDLANKITTWRDRKAEEALAAAARKEADRLAREKEAARIAEAKAAEEAKAAAARAAAEVAAKAEKERLEAIRTDAPAVPCQRRYTDQMNCMTVTFGHKTKYDRTAMKDHCIVADPSDTLIRTDLGGGQYRWEGPDGLVAQFFDLPLGASVGSFTCGP